MRILFVTYHFPPYRSMGAVRTGQTAKYLLDLGHDVRVLTARRQPFQQTLSLEVPTGKVTYTPWLGCRFFVRTAELEQLNDMKQGQKSIPNTATRAAKPLLKFLRRNVVYVPDERIGWFPFAVVAAKRLISSDPVDLIFASSMPITSLLVAATVARACGVPWVGELRDLWSENHYRDLRTWQRGIDRYLERRVLASASGLVTVSEPWAEALRKVCQPVAVVSNGFERCRRSDGLKVSNPQRLTIVYSGSLYGGKRDPTPLFRAVRSLGDKGKSVEMSFFGWEESLVMDLARSAGVEERVRAFGEIPYQESLDVQAAADVLLLLLWNKPGEEGVMPGKLFEYMGAARPILAMGMTRGVAAELIESRSLGLASSDPVRIGEQLERWLEEKKRTGRVAPIPGEAIREYDRRTQTEKLAAFLESVVSSRACCQADLRIRL